ncbi:hypothetical protein AAZX31_04G108000 [Glycine max]
MTRSFSIDFIIIFVSWTCHEFQCFNFNYFFSSGFHYNICVSVLKLPMLAWYPCKFCCSRFQGIKYFSTSSKKSWFILIYGKRNCSYKVRECMEKEIFPIMTEACFSSLSCLLSYKKNRNRKILRRF